MNINENKVFIVAEAGVNHDGSISKALELIDAAIYAGADAVKFQTYKTEQYVTKKAGKAQYQKDATGINENQFQMIKNLELKYEDYYALKDKCFQNQIKFLSTAFDHESLKFLVNDLKVETLKIPSGEITNGPYLLEHSKCKKELIVSTGMSSFDEIELALGVIAFGLLGSKNPCEENFKKSFNSESGQDILKRYVTLLHCTSNYPADYFEINLNAMIELGKRFKLPIGYSDHSKGKLVSISAASMGAKYIEKHFTLDKNSSGPDHSASLEPEELKEMVRDIRDIELIRGSNIKEPQVSEIDNQKVVRRSIVAIDVINKGEIFTEKNIGVKRPATGKNPMKYWELIGQKSDKDYDYDDFI